MSSEYLYAVSNLKGKLLTVRVDVDTLIDFNTACDLRGATASSYLHQYVVKTIREEKEANALAFAKARKIAASKYRKRSQSNAAKNNSSKAAEFNIDLADTLALKNEKKA
jgi:hypothetical protein